ncbi:glycosyl transferase [Bifidobacterium pseudolongum subsp. globosum]|nr:glycosyl transferase [Bifidobacterium pseudolongum subsp. globosum]
MSVTEKEKSMLGVQQNVTHKDCIMSDPAKRTTIYIVSHKDFIAPEMTGYLPILAGAAHNQADITLKDDEEINISTKNPQYCELTAQYWVWKNALNQSDNIGFVHYRRYFYKNKFKKQIVTGECFARDLQHYDVVLPEPWILSKTVRNQFAQFHNTSDLEMVRNVLAERDPKYVPVLDRVLAGHELYSYNMFVMGRRLFDEYMTWLFGVLEEVERRVDTSAYDQYNQRLFGFLSERLLTVWVKARDLKVKCYPVYKPNDRWWEEAVRYTVKKLVYKYVD